MDRFKELRDLFSEHVQKMIKGESVLFTVDVDKDELWNLYLGSFPAGTNDIYRERRNHDCSACRHFVKSFGNVVVINKSYQVVSIWDFDAKSDVYQPVIDALASFVKTFPVCDVFITKEKRFGTDYNRELLEDKSVFTWHHFYIELPAKFVSKSSETVGALQSVARDRKNVFKRSLGTISEYAIEAVLDLISQNSLYKGMEWKEQLVKFLVLHNDYHKLQTKKAKDNYCWLVSCMVGGAMSKIRNHSIGVLLTDISEGVDLDVAVKRYENIVAPTNYKRPKAIFTKKMIEQAEQTIKDLGFENSLGRRHAVLDDITINNIIFANKDVRKRITDNSVFEDMKLESVSAGRKDFEGVEEVPIEKFISDILPRTTSVEVLLENRLISGMTSLIAPKVSGSPSMFKWDNGFSWAYAGNITDSLMKERVKMAGGNTDGVLRFSIQWNTEAEHNPNDFDAHCVEPDGNHIHFRNKGAVHSSSGKLDVDIINPSPGVPAVENIVWTDKNKMPEGKYKMFVHNYTHRGGRNGFSAEIEFDGIIHKFEYNKELRHDENVIVAEINYTKQSGFVITKSLESTIASRNAWNLTTQRFHPVSVIMYSPNYWDGQSGIGHKHYFFMLINCINDTMPNGFFNEFLNESLMKHKRVFEALGSKLRVERSDEQQLSGLGFSSTQRNHVMCKIEGHVTRIIKIVF